jgi:hypothetical protein
MTLKEILESQELLTLADVVVPPCSNAAGASSRSVQDRLAHIYTTYRSQEAEALKSLLDSVNQASWSNHPYFPTFAETVTEAYWSCETGLTLAGFKVSNYVSS